MDCRNRAVRGFRNCRPEYNYGPAAVLKNAIDWVYPEWNRKAVAFVSYGGTGGVRSVQRLRSSSHRFAPRFTSPPPPYGLTFRVAMSMPALPSLNGLLR
jgi:NAD(P)H-dependent FMN reductase